MPSLYLYAHTFLALSVPFFANGFSASPPSSPFNDVLQNLSSLFNSNNSNRNSNQKIELRRSELKNELLELCQSKKADRSDIDVAIDRLKEVRPFAGTANSPLLQKEWSLIWTTEKEINIFSDWNISGDITQTIQSNKLVNDIPFRKGGSFAVNGIVTPDEEREERTNFKFESAKLDVQWFAVTLPPIGEGWFDTVYLDESFRVDVNSRDDILICSCAEL
mmetsp:Transcript_4299/g.6557  ORF Transcript_4299/g.6557 Transcript_4299/m.6557 type:complete len:220 (-) Transcript_4299:655-1314(-)